ncbi:MAG: ATP-binding cassette domain-containing protein [Actinomycetota bacterium]|nr:ATP-binding cassette domain-containing protein [Actinomycetota bacterium]
MIHYEKVRVTFDGVDVLRDFDLSVDAGDKVLIYGKSGVGKSTILKLLLGFARPDAGAVYFEGRVLDKGLVWEVRKRVAYVSQDMDIGEGKVAGFIEDIMSYKANQDLNDLDSRMRRAMDLFELNRSILEKDMGDLSGGEKQRVGLTVAVLLGRGIYLLDEVTSAVDQEMKKKIVDYFAGLEGKTVLSVSHDVNWLEKDGFKVVRMGVG